MADIPSIGELSKAIRDFRSGLSLSLPDYLKTTKIMSRMYIGENLYEEEILIPLISMINQIYCGYVLTALQLNQYVQGNRTVRDMLEMVSTNSARHIDLDTDLTANFVNPYNLSVHQEGFGTSVLELDPKEQKLFSGRVIELDLGVPGARITETDDHDAKNPFHKDVFERDDNMRMQQIKVSVMVQLIPYLTSPLVLGELLKLNLHPSLGVRFTKAWVGEINFISDFMFEMDLIKDRRKALKEDKSGVLFDILQQQSNALSRALLRYVGVLPKNFNTANTIMIIHDRDFKEACHKASIDFSRLSDRERFFRETFMMKVLVVDPMYGKVTIYYNGLNSVGVYSFNKIMANANAGSKGSDKYDLQSIMTAVASGISPKF